MRESNWDAISDNGDKTSLLFIQIISIILAVCFLLFVFVLLAGDWSDV